MTTELTTTPPPHRLHGLSKGAVKVSVRPLHRIYDTPPLNEVDREANHRKSSIRAKIENPFLILIHLWSFAKVQYRALTKNANLAFAMLAANSVLKHGRQLLERARPT